MTNTQVVVVVGGGISGLSYAWKASTHGHTVKLLEANTHVGGCIESHRTKDDYWFEMGAHTVYNSYSGFLDMLVDTGLRERMIERGPARSTFGLLRDDTVQWLTPPKILWRLNWLEAAWRFPFNVFRSTAGLSLSTHYSRLLGPKNFACTLSPFLAAVPSQNADNFPVSGPGSLFKKRTRRKEFMRSFGLQGGLQSLAEAVAANPNIEVETGIQVKELVPEGDTMLLRTSATKTFRADHVALALPADEAARITHHVSTTLAHALNAIQMVEVSSVGVVLPSEQCWMPPCAFVVPHKDLFFSMVTRDAFPDDTHRAFCFHFKPGLGRQTQLKRIAQLLRVDASSLDQVVEKRTRLPAPNIAHAKHVAAIDAALSETKIALTGNYFDGLAIEDCVQRSFAEWERMSKKSDALKR